MSYDMGEPIPLPARFASIKKRLIAGKEAQVVASWGRLLTELRAEIDLVARVGSNAIPTLDFGCIYDETLVAGFVAEVKRRGVAVLRNVVPQQVATEWKRETGAYLSTNPHTRTLPPRDPHLFGAYWTPAQINGRAHPNVLAAQRFLMNLWHSTDPNALVSSNFPVTYADRLRIRTPGDTSYFLAAHVDGGSVERWETDGYGRGGTYQKIWDGRWEDYDPWESSTRLSVTSDLYNGAGSCSMFRMFQGWLSLSTVDPAHGTLLLCPMLKLATAYFLLRPFFSPKNTAAVTGSSFLDAANWTLDPIPTSVIQGAIPGYAQELNEQLHPHLQLSRSMVPIPRLEPGDYVLWHCDTVYAIDAAPPIPPSHTSSSATPFAHPSSPTSSTPVANDAAVMYIPACPLTQTNALYLARQRKAFLLGHPSPDFGGGRGESTHMGRPGVLEVNNAGGEDALRAMGLLPWEEGVAMEAIDGEVLRMANGILFPDRYDLL